MTINLNTIPSSRGSGATTAFSLVSSNRSGPQTVIDIIPLQALTEKGLKPEKVLSTFREKARATGTRTKTAIRKLRRSARHHLGIGQDA